MKTCYVCKRSLDPLEFGVLRRAKDGLNTCCKECNRAAAARHYEIHGVAKNQAKRDYYAANRDDVSRKAAAANRKRERAHKARITKYLIANPCVDCGERDPVVLDFDHQGDKSFGISGSAGRMAWVRIEREITKCDVRCSNCHRRKSYRDFGDGTRAAGRPAAGLNIDTGLPE